ncbi:MAG: phosphoribosylglycinamide formyltransferase [Persephonella sp.]|nr:MAG: phosphoribosylglycinamide formyltransferase [Persephonella sp.]
MLNIVVLISGRGSNLEAILEGIKAGKIKGKISLVISNKRNARGLQIAKEYGIKTLFVNPKDFESREDYDRFLVKIIKKENPDLIVLAGYMRILTDYFIDSFPNKIINIHPSLIPAFRGLKAQKQALEFGAKYTGCTVHFVSKELDSGAVIIQAVVPVLPEDTEESLSDRILQMEHRIYPQTIKWFADNRIKLNGRKVIVENATYGELPTNPKLEDF